MTTMPRAVHAEPVLATTRIQGDVLPGLLKNELLLFFRIDSAADFLPFLQGLPLPSMQTVLDQRAEVAERRSRSATALVPAPGPASSGEGRRSAARRPARRSGGLCVRPRSPRFFTFT